MKMVKLRIEFHDSKTINSFYIFLLTLLSYKGAFLQSKNNDQSAYTAARRCKQIIVAKPVQETLLCARCPVKFSKNYQKVNKTSTEARLVPGTSTAELNQLKMCKQSVQCPSAWPKPILPKPILPNPKTKQSGKARFLDKLI